MAFTHITETSEDIIKYLKDRDFNLTPEDKEFIRKRTYDSIIDASNSKSNGCDCGQVWCPICN